MNDNFQNYIMWMEDNIEDLSQLVSSFHSQDNILDYSVKSLKYVEEFLENQLNEYTIEIFSIHKLIEIVSSYMGQIVRRQLNGEWALCLDEEDFDYGYPMVIKLKGLPEDFGWSPIQDVFNYQQSRKNGLLIQATNSVLNPFD